jgi:hypothetical protein
MPLESFQIADYVPTQRRAVDGGNLSYTDYIDVAAEQNKLAMEFALKRRPEQYQEVQTPSTKRWTYMEESVKKQTLKELYHLNSRQQVVSNFRSTQDSL